MMELHKKERSIKELNLQSEEDRKSIIILQESLNKLNEKIKMYKRQLEEQESISSIMCIKKLQRELENLPARKKPSPLANRFRSSKASSHPQLRGEHHWWILHRWILHRHRH